MSESYGQPLDPSEGRHLEFRIMAPDGTSIEAVAHQSVVRNLVVNESVTGIGHFEAKIVAGEEDAGILRHLQYGATVEIWATRSPDPLSMLLRAHVDYVERKTGTDVIDDSEGPAKVEAFLEGRSKAAPCMDKAVSRANSGSFSELVENLAEAAPAINVELEVDDQVEYYVDVASGYAGLRLLALAFDDQVRVERDGTIVYRDKKSGLKANRERKTHTITSKDIRGSTMRQGRRIKKG